MTAARLPVLVSRCLLGEPCRYDGRSKGGLAERLLAPQTLARIRWIPICPETDGGLPVPRPPCEIDPGASARDVLEGRACVRSREGFDATAEYIRGALLACEAARREGARHALLKARSPSCGPDGVYDGAFRGILRPGRGVAAQALAQAGVLVTSEETPGAGLAGLFRAAEQREHLE